MTFFTKLFLIIINFVFVSSLYSQNSEKDSTEYSTSEINVTSTKTEVTLQQTPSTISIVDSTDIINRNILTFDNILEDVPGILIARSNGINISSLSIRGSSDVAGGGIGNRVLLLLDGRPSLTGDSKGALWALIPTSIIERTEVVKGAFSSLYGSSAIGGVVNVITKKPTLKSFTSINTNFGFYNKLSDSLRFSDKVQTFRGIDLLQSNSLKKFSYLVNLNYKKNDGHAQQTNYEFYGLTGKFNIDIFSNRDLELTLQYTNSNSGFPHYWRKDPGRTADPFKVADYYIGDKIDKQTSSIDLFYRAFPNYKSKYTTRFYYYQLNSTSFYNPNNPVSQLFGSPVTGLETFINSYNLGNISQFDYEFDYNNYFISGIDLQWNIVRSNPAYILYGDQQMNNFGIFAQHRIYLLNDKNGFNYLTAIGGLRYDIANIVGGINSSEISPKISFVFSPAQTGFFQNSSFRFLAGKAFRAPSIAELYFKKELFGGFDFVYNPNLKPEEIFSVELGLRKEFENLSFDISGFYNNYKNLIQYVNIGSGAYGPFQVQNVAKARITGFEISTSYKNSAKLFDNKLEYQLSSNYTFVNAKDLSGLGIDDYLPYKPKHNLNIESNILYEGFNLNLTGKYVSKVDEVLFYKFEEPDEYFMMDMKLSKDITKNLNLYFAVNNLFDKFYQELERIPAPNRNFNAGFKLKF
ncbi:MAG: TonB-dependent receptor [Ignavibacteria bacterium]|nr:TonB-dependent receptor [Ignavibacteria bacterium]